MIPKRALNKPLLYFGDTDRVEEFNEEVEQNLGIPPPGLQVILLLILPATVLHELSHYVTAKLLGVDVECVVLFQFSWAVGMVSYPGETVRWKREVIKASPVVFLLLGGWVMVVYLFPLAENNPIWFFGCIVLGFYLVSNFLPDQL